MFKATRNIYFFEDVCSEYVNGEHWASALTEQFIIYTQPQWKRSGELVLGQIKFYFHSLVTSHIDCCHATLTGVPRNSFNDK